MSGFVAFSGSAHKLYGRTFVTLNYRSRSENFANLTYDDTELEDSQVEEEDSQADEEEDSQNEGIWQLASKTLNDMMCVASLWTMEEDEFNSKVFELVDDFKVELAVTSSQEFGDLDVFVGGGEDALQEVQAPQSSRQTIQDRSRCQAGTE